MSQTLKHKQMPRAIHSYVNHERSLTLMKTNCLSVTRSLCVPTERQIDETSPEDEH